MIEPVLRSTIVVRRLISLVASLLVVVSTLRVAHAQPATGPEQSLNQKIAVWRFDPLGIDAEPVSRLEQLFRMELERLAKQPMPSRRDIERVLTAEQRECTGEERCLGAIGKKLGVEIVITGTVGAMGTNYVLNIKAVETASSKTIRRIESEPLRGEPDDLIDGARVAAYRLLAPDQLHGSVQIQTDLVGAAVSLDDKGLGKTPLPNLGVISKLTLGKHRLRVEAPGYSPFEEDVVVHFQKVSQVVVRLLPSTEVIGTGRIATVERQPIYTKTWFLVLLGVGAVAIGAGIGYTFGKVECRRITSMGEVPC
jgi:hypothetical protein